MTAPDPDATAADEASDPQRDTPVPPVPPVPPAPSDPDDPPADPDAPLNPA